MFAISHKPSGWIGQGTVNRLMLLGGTVAYHSLLSPATNLPC